jgi:hypothetical protein
MDCSGWKIASREVSNESIKPGDRPDRELVQFVHVDKIGSKNPEWDEIEETVYGHIDQVGGAGIQTGYAVITLKAVKSCGISLKVPITLRRSRTIVGSSLTSVCFAL